MPQQAVLSEKCAFVKALDVAQSTTEVVVVVVFEEYICQCLWT